MRTLHGIDLSHWNTIADYNAIVKNNSFVILKASEGNSTAGIDATYYQRFQELSLRNATLGAYHFVRPGNGKDDAYNFLNAIKGTKPLIIGLDIEVPGINLEYINTWCEIVRYRTGVTPHIYINLSYLKRYTWDTVAGKYPLWLAAYRPTIPTDIKPWDQVSIWQRTSTGTTPGVTGNVDLNTMYIKDETVARTTTGTIEVRDAWNAPVDKTLSPQDYDAKLFNYVSTMGRDVQTIKETLLKLSK